MSKLDFAPGVVEVSTARHKEKLQLYQRQRREDDEDVQAHAVLQDTRRTTTMYAVEPTREEEEEEEEEEVVKPVFIEPPPPQPPQSGQCGVTWVIIVLLIACVVAITPLIVAHQFIQHSQSPTAVAAASVYPLWTAVHDTRSVPLALDTDLVARPLLASLEHTFRAHFEMSSQFECLCMTHVMVPFFGTERASYQVCGVYNRPVRQLYMLVNPVITGRSNQTDSYIESSVACVKERRNVARARVVFMEWTDPTTRSGMYARFIGVQAAALQLALDEMSIGGPTLCMT
jgi:hypothetical protein